MEIFGKKFVIGDIHGRSKALKQVLERSGFNKDEDTLIFVGDVVDRGWEPFKCIEMLLEIKNLIAINGNHDENFFDYIKTGHDGFNGLNGVQITKELWKIEIDLERREKIIGYFKNTLPYYIDPENRIFTHGGFYPAASVATQHKYIFAWDRKMWKKNAMKCKNDDKIKTKDNFSEIYIGHTPTIIYAEVEEISAEGIITKLQNVITYPMYRGGVWNMDTGAGFSEGKLSIMNIDTKEIFQSDLISDLYGTIK